MSDQKKREIDAEPRVSESQTVSFTDDKTEQFWFAALVDSAEDAVISKTFDGVVKSWNKAAERIFGFKADEIIGQPIFKIIPPERQNEEPEILEKIRRGERIEHYETVRRTKSGALLDVALTVSPIRDADGTITGISKIARDISHAKRIEKRLNESEQQYRTLFDSIDQGFCVCEILFDEKGNPSDYRFVEVNPAFETITGIPNTEAVGNKTARQLVPNLEQSWVDIYGKIAVSGESARFTRKSEARGRWFDVYGFRVGGDGSHKVALLFNDITQNKFIEENLLESRKMLSLAMTSSRMGVWSRDLITDEVFWSQELEALFGLAPGTFSGTTNGFRDYVFEEDRERLAMVVRRAIEERTDYIIEFRFRHADGTLRWMEGRGQAVYAADGTPLKSYGIGIDITERKLQELDRQFFIEISEKIRQGEIVGENTLGEITRLTNVYFDTARCLFIEINEPENRGVIRHEHCRRSVASVAGEYKISDYSPETLAEIKTGRVIVNHDTENDPRTAELYRRVYEPYDERAYISIPLFTSGRWTAIFWVSDDRQRDWSEREITLLASIGERAWLAAEKVRNEKALEQSRHRLQMAMDAAKIFSWELNPADFQIEWSNNFALVTGFSPPPSAKHNLMDLVHPQDRQTLAQKIAASIQTREKYQSEFRFVDPATGEIVWMNAQGILIESFAGEEPRFVGITQNINERKRAEQEREKLLERERVARREAEEASRLKDEFLATVSHELRTPLNAILGWAQMLDAGKIETADIARAVKTIYRNAKSQAQLIEDILDVSRIITGKFRIETKSLILSPIVQAAVETLRPSIEAKNIKLQMILDFEARPVLVDADRMLQVFWNLVSNAVKFTPENGRVRIELKNNSSEVKIIVSDSGKGISADFLPYVFDRFRQADGTSTRTHGGLGLGLSIVRHIVELHGGAVDVFSEGVGLGTTFTISLPIYKASENNAKIKELSFGETSSKTLEQSAENSENDYQNRFSHLRVLLIDDEPDTLEMLAMMLSPTGAHVKKNRNVAEALATIADWTPHLIISDIGMPETDGYAFIEKLRKLPPENGGVVPVIALTAYTGANEQGKILSSGFQFYLPKPLDSAILFDAIAKLTEKIENP